MDLPKLLRELHDERKRLAGAIAALERLALAKQRTRGRPPKGFQKAIDFEPKTENDKRK